jgi:hypothetical protein
MNPVWGPGEERMGRWDGSLRWRWPADYRQFMFWVFAVWPLLSLAKILYLYSLHRLYWFPLLRNMLIGPWFSVHTAAISGLAASSIWNGKPWARGWAIAGSLMFLVMYFRQFVIIVQPSWDHHLGVLFIGILGLGAFVWPDKQVDASRSGSANS